MLIFHFDSCSALLFHWSHFHHANAATSWEELIWRRRWQIAESAGSRNFRSWSIQYQRATNIEAEIVRSRSCQEPNFWETGVFQTNWTEANIFRSWTCQKTKLSGAETCQIQCWQKQKQSKAKVIETRSSQKKFSKEIVDRSLPICGDDPEVVK